MAVAEKIEQEIPRARSQWVRAWERFRRHRLAFASLCFIAVLIIVAILAPLVAPYPYTETHYDAIMATTGHPQYTLGTDELGRDILSRLIYSLRTALMIGFGAELVALTLAIIVGILAGYRGGRVDQVLMAITDIMYAFPSYLFNVILVTVIGRNLWVMFIAIGISSWAGMARLVRGQVLSLRVREFVEAAQSMGATGWTISMRYILPNAVGPILVSLSFGIPGAIMAEAGLSLLGLGVQPPTPSWGEMIRVGARYVLTAPHMLIWPSGLFGLTMLAFTWLGDGLRDAFDTQE